MMEEADILVVAHMEGWDKSVGIAEEIRFFHVEGKPVFDLPNLDSLQMTRRWPEKPARERYDGASEETLDTAKREYLEHAPRA
jgi:hypothetical protein